MIVFIFKPIHMFTRIYRSFNGKNFNIFNVIAHASDESRIILGYPAFINNDIVFDYDNNEVGFVSDIYHL